MSAPESSSNALNPTELLTNPEACDHSAAIAEPPPPPSDQPQPNATPCDINDQIASPNLTPPPPALDPRQLTAITLLISGKTIAAAAATLGVHRATLHRWKSDPAFAAELNARQNDLAQTIDRRVRRILLHATQTCIASLKVKDAEQCHRNAFRLISALRPWMSRLDAILQDSPPDDASEDSPAEHGLRFNNRAG